VSGPPAVVVCQPMSAQGVHIVVKGFEVVSDGLMKVSEPFVGES
jgi:hypothetical protein